MLVVAGVMVYEILVMEDNYFCFGIEGVSDDVITMTSYSGRQNVGLKTVDLFQVVLASVSEES